MEDEVIVKVENLSHRYSVQWAVRDINFEIFKMECMVCWAPMVQANLQ